MRACEHDIHVCVCKAEYLLFNLECHEGKLKMISKKYILTCVKVGYLNSVYHNILICINRHELDKIITWYNACFPSLYVGNILISSQNLILTYKLKKFSNPY